MNLTKLFWFELIIGSILLVSGIFIFLFSVKVMPNSITFYLGLFLFYGYLQITLTRKKEHSEKDWFIIRKSMFASFLIVFLVTMIFLMNSNKILFYNSDHYNFHFLLLLISSYLITHSIAGFLFSYIYSDNKVTPEDNKEMIEPAKPPENFLILNYPLFFTIIVGGIFLFILTLAFWHPGDNPLEIMAMPLAIIAIVFIMYYSKPAGRRNPDEREKYFIYKTSSIALFIGLIASMLLYVNKESFLFGVKINDIWGPILFPLFVLLWGVIGLFLHIKEEGGIMHAIYKTKKYSTKFHFRSNYEN